MCKFIYITITPIISIFFLFFRAKRPGLDLTFHRAIDLTRDIKVEIKTYQSFHYERHDDEGLDDYEGQDVDDNVHQASARLAAELGFTRILTSGGAATALQVHHHHLYHHYCHNHHHENDQGAVTIADLVSELPDVNVMPGGGISEENMAEVILMILMVVVVMI